MSFDASATNFRGSAWERLADSGIEFAVATINDREIADRFFAAGAQTVLSDLPDLYG